MEPEDAPRAAPAPLRQRVVNSLVWSLAGFGTLQILRFAFNLVLTRLLLPEVFGLVALVDLFLLGLQMFSDVGVSLSIIRGERGDDPEYLNTAWSVQVVRGFCLWLAACALAWPLAVCYRTPELLYFLPIVGLTVIFNGFNSVAIFTCERHLSQGRLVLLQVGTYLVSTSAILAWLLLVDLSVWALVVGRLASSVVEMVGSHWVLGGPRCRFRWDRAVVAEILQFGKWIFISTGCTFLAEQADRLIIGRVTSLATLGVYNLAVQLALAARQVMHTITSRVVFPYCSRRFQQGVDLPTICRTAHPRAAAFAAFVTSGLISAGPAFVRCLFRPEYHAAGWMLQLLAIGSWITMLQMLSGSLLWVLGDARSQAVGMALKLAATPICAWGGYALAGLGGMIVGFTVAELLRYGVTLWALRDQGLPLLRYDTCLSAAIVLSWAAATQAGSLLAGPGQRWTELIVAVLTVVFLWLGFAILVRRAASGTTADGATVVPDGPTVPA
jgi:O-antigen/teichoic acid export membrane protein